MDTCGVEWLVFGCGGRSRDSQSQLN